MMYSHGTCTWALMRTSEIFRCVASSVYLSVAIYSKINIVAYNIDLGVGISDYLGSEVMVRSGTLFATHISKS